MNEEMQKTVDAGRRTFDQDFDRLGTVKRYIVDSCVAAVLSEVESLPQDVLKLLQDACRAAATNAVSQFSSYVEGSVRIIELHHKMKDHAAFIQRIQPQTLREAMAKQVDFAQTEAFKPDRYRK